MKLPEPVRRAWVGHRETLLRIAGEKAGGRLLIGGGTILASRWETMAGQGIAELIRQKRRGPIFDTSNTNPVNEIREAAETVLAREEGELD